LWLWLVRDGRASVDGVLVRGAEREATGLELDEGEKDDVLASKADASA
jgi:hypothetical protein